MLNSKKRLYDYSQYGENNAYGQPVLSDVLGQVKMAITVTSQAIQDNIQYHNATYMGLTYANVDDTYVIHYEGRKLKVLYVNTQGRENQVFMSEM